MYSMVWKSHVYTLYEDLPAKGTVWNIDVSLAFWGGPTFQFLKSVYKAINENIICGSVIITFIVELMLIVSEL